MAGLNPLAPPARFPCDQGRDRRGGASTWRMAPPRVRQANAYQTASNRFRHHEVLRIPRFSSCRYVMLCACVQPSRVSTQSRPWALHVGRKHLTRFVGAVRSDRLLLVVSSSPGRCRSNALSWMSTYPRRREYIV